MLWVGFSGGWGADCLAQPDSRPGVQNTADPPQPAWKVVDPADVLVPQTLLPLLHAGEVQEELGLDTDQIARLEKLFGEIDGDWFRSRNLPVADRRRVIADLESRVLESLGQSLPATALLRLRQLECQAQSVRMLLRPEIAGFLRLTAEQQEAFRKAASATEQQVAAAGERMQNSMPAAEAEKLVADARASEQREVAVQLQADQAKMLGAVAGEAFDTAGLTRIFPMAPELIVTDGWYGTPPGSLSSLRGKVVIVHFYAFQCSNCQQNLPRYNEWQDQFEGEDVVLIGIQTPETPLEREADQIERAAREQGIRYPVLLDLKGSNWAAWSNTMWPTVYVIDRRGYLRTWWQGELNWQGATGDRQIAELVRQLLAGK